MLDLTSHRFEFEFKAFLCGALTLVAAVVIVRDLVVGISGFGAVVGPFATKSLTYASADNPIGYGIMIIQKIAILIFCGTETLHFIGVIADDPVRILMQAVETTAGSVTQPPWPSG